MSISNTIAVEDHITIKEEVVNSNLYGGEYIKLGKEYKKTKFYFINSFQNYSLYTKSNEASPRDNKKLQILTTNIITRIFKYMDIFMINDLEDLVNIMMRRNTNDLETKMEIYCYVENTFNPRLYNILIEESLKKRYNALLNNKTFLESQPSDFLANYIHKNCLMYVAIIRTEIFKIIMIKALMAKGIMNIQNMSSDEKHKSIVFGNYIVGMNNMIEISKKTIIHHYNDLRKNFSMCVEHIEDCKNMIITNGILK